MIIDLMKKRFYFTYITISVLVIILFTGCNLHMKRTASLPPIATRHAEWQQTLTPGQEVASTPSALKTSEVIQPQPDTPDDNTGIDGTLIYLHPGLPTSLVDALNIPSSNRVESQENADVSVWPGRRDGQQPNLPDSTWVYALVAPFYTLSDGVSLSAIKSLWQGEDVADLNFSQILVTPEVYALMSEIMGSPTGAQVGVVSDKALRELALTNQPILSLIPFEELTPEWKILRVDGLSPIDDVFSTEEYPLAVPIWVESKSRHRINSLPATNYNIDQRTVLLMTGVTALVRATAHRMDIQGNTYPGKDIYPWFTAADLVHISNEAPFYENCPTPDPFQPDLIFCSSPDRIELLEHISADIIELSGNHLLDYGLPAINLTLDMYEERGWTTYAGGWDLQVARTPAKITHNGNQLAFIGCNPVGPPAAWATDTQPGSAPCGDYQWMLDEIQVLRADGYLPIVTLQYDEDYIAYPSPKMEADFKRIADAGAIVVNGSQAHVPMSLIFYENSFLHFGLGNLFFDQMQVVYNNTEMQGTREGFIDRLVFYDGQLVSIELLTTMLEDYARPRPMNLSERTALLTRIFRIALDAYQ